MDASLHNACPAYYLACLLNTNPEGSNAVMLCPNKSKRYETADSLLGYRQYNACSIGLCRAATILINIHYTCPSYHSDIIITDSYTLNLSKRPVTRSLHLKQSVIRPLLCSMQQQQSLHACLQHLLVSACHVLCWLRKHISWCLFHG